MEAITLTVTVLLFGCALHSLHAIKTALIVNIRQSSESVQIGGTMVIFHARGQLIDLLIGKKLIPDDKPLIPSLQQDLTSP